MTLFVRTVLFMALVVGVADTLAYLIPNPGGPMQMSDGSPPPPPPGETQGPRGPGFPPPEDRGPPPMNPPSRTAWLAVVGLEAVTLLPLAWLFAYTLAAPLKRFSEASKRAGRDAGLAPLPREGTREMVAAIDSFNSMQSRLERLIAERTQMVGAIAHDLRTPLTRLAFRLDELEPPLGDKVREDISEMRTMIAAALDFIRDRSSRAQHERLDLRLLVERVVEEQSDLGHDVVLQTGAPVTIQGDPLALRRAVANVIENAVRYGERARVELTQVTSQCRLDIDDDGPGIPESQQSLVFDPFYRVEASRNRHTGGIGLGLAAVRAIILEHSGEVLLGNRRDRGLRVTIKLPVSS